jgi:uncharacterized protein YciI
MQPSSDDPAFELDRFELVLLKRPLERSTISEEETDRLQELHMAHLQALTKSGDIRVAGPFDEQPDQSLRGMALYQTGSIERARELASSDPAIVAGRIEVDVMFFYCPKGSL